MYWPPESGNIEPSSAKATHAQSEISPPRIHTRKNSFGLGSGPAMSLAVRKMEEPMIPLTRRSTESSRESPRIRVGFWAEASAGAFSSWVVFIPDAVSLWVFVSLSHRQLFRRFQWSSAAAADYSGAIAAD